MTLCAAMVALTTNSFALLPPLYQSMSELQGLLEDPQLSKVINDAEPIMSIDRTENGFRITTNKHAVDVTVKTRPQRMPGPAKFQYVFGTPQPRNY